MKYNERVISTHFFNDLKEGILSQITKECKHNRELLFIQDGYVNVYHQGRSLLKIEEKERSKNYRLSFDFNYARYEENWPDLLKQMNQLGFVLTKTGEKISDRELVVTIPFSGDFSACESSFEILRGLIENFIKPCEHTIPKYDYFKAHDGLGQPRQQHQSIWKNSDSRRLRLLIGAWAMGIVNMHNRVRAKRKKIWDDMILWLCGIKPESQRLSLLSN